MNARFVSISLAAALVLAAGTEAVAQYRTAPPMGGAAGGGMQGSGPQRSYQSVPGSGPEKSRTAQEALQQDPKLAESLSKLLPAGTDVQAAASGFRTLGDFVAALHVSKNLGISFADLRTKMVAGGSLEASIQALKPDADAMIEARKARGQAEELTGG